MSQETWRPIPGYPKYEASSLGRIRSLDRFIFRKNRWGYRARFFQRGIIRSTKSENNSGYLTIEFGVRLKRSMVHRLVCSAFHGKPKPGMVVSHKNGIKTDNRSENLEWLSVRDNIIHGRRFLGKKGRNYDVDFAKGIILAIGHGETVVRLSERLGTSRQYISSVINGKQYPSRDYPELADLRERVNYRSPTHKERSLYRRSRRSVKSLSPS